jgi:hypothetical protein
LVSQNNERLRVFEERVFEERVLRGISGPQRRKSHKAGEHRIMRIFIACTFLQILSGLR